MPHRDPEKRREYNKLWRQNNPQKVRESEQKSRLKHREERLAAWRLWCKKNKRDPIKQREYYKRWRLKHLEQARERRRKWDAEHPAQKLERTQRAKEKKNLKLQELKARLSEIADGHHPAPDF